MLFSLLTRLLLWLLIAVIAYAILLQWIPKKYYTWLGGILIFTLIVLTFFNPGVVVVASVWKLLVFPLTPLGLALTLILSGMLHFKDKEIGNPGKQLLWAGFTILVFFSLPLIAYTLASQAEWESVTKAQQRFANCQAVCPAPLAENIRAIVLLGQGTTETLLPDRRQSNTQVSITSQNIQLSDRGDLIFHTVQIFWEAISQDQDPLIIVTGRPRFQGLSIVQGPGEADAIVDLLERLGVHRSNLRPAPPGDNLYRCAVQVKELLRAQGLQGTPVALVTSALQMRRAELTFAQLDMVVVPSPTDFITLQPLPIWKRLRLEDIIPNAKALVISTKVTNEYLATIYYFLRGWLSPFL